MTDIDGTEERLYDVKRDPGQTRNIASESGDVCGMMKDRLWGEMGGDPPRYEVMREGHEWYEYPDVYDPTTDASRKLLEKRKM
jgi:hypothetical protein